MTFTNFSSSPFVAHPFKGHVFQGSANAFECSVCHQTRAMHLHDGFIPSMARENLTPFYRRHPRWTPNIRNEKERTLVELA